MGPGNSRVDQSNNEAEQKNSTLPASFIGMVDSEKNQPTHGNQTCHETITIDDENNTNNEQQQHQQQVQLSDFIGEHGAYQFAITALLFIRYVFLGLMANSGPLMTPDVTFYCSLPMIEVLSIMPNISTLSSHEQELEIKEEFKQICQIDLHLYQNQSQLEALNHSRSFRTSPIGQLGKLNLNFTERAPLDPIPRIRECVDFTYDLAPDQGQTMTSEFDLVCDRDWLRSLFQSLISASIVLAHVFWGTFSDKYGRFQAQRLCIIVSFVAGLLSVLAIDFWTFTLARAFCSFGDLGLVVSQTTIVVELVGQRYRGSSVALVNFGFALGVSLLPYMVAYFEDFRLVTGVTVFCHIITMPFILATNESPRWLLTNRKFKAAKKELKRIARFNQAYHSICHTISSTLIKTTTKARQDAKDGTQEEQLQSKETSSREQKERFEKLLKKFIEQIEMQNLYDPIATGTGPLSTSQQPNPPLSPKNRAPAIVQQPAHNSDLNKQQGAAKSLRHKAQPPLIVRIQSCSQAPMPDYVEERKFDSGLIVNRMNQNYSTSGSNPADLASTSNLEATRRSPQIRRSLSYNELSKSHYIESLSIPPTSNCLHHLNKKQQNSIMADSPKWKTQTLPAVSGASSLIGDNLDDNELLHQPIRRSGANGVQPSDCITSCNMVAHQLSFVGRVSQLFKDKKLMIVVFTIVWTTFNSELLYTSFIIINLEVGEDVYLNYVLGGCMEALAAISASLMLSYSPRRVSLIAFWLLISLSCFGLSLAHIDSTWAVWMLALAKFSQSSLSSIASVAAYESFPTFLRQSGSGLVFTLGMMGSVFAPLIFAEFDDHAGMDRVLMTFSCSSLTAAILIYLFLNETRGCELT